MSATGGGRSFPVYIDLILRGAPQVQRELQNLVRQAQGLAPAANTASRSVNQLEQGLRRVAPTSTQVATGLQAGGRGAQVFNAQLAPLQATARTTIAPFQQLGGQIQMVGNTAASTGTRFSPLVSAISQAGPAANTTAGSMSRMGAMTTAVRENIRSMIFPIGGMIGALNEAAFMSGRVADMQEAHAAAQAEVTRLTELGLEGTSQYVDAQKDLEKATRALNFTQRIATQSWFDVVFFMGSLLGSITGVISRFNELKSATGVSANALNLFNNTSNTALGRLKALGTGIGHSIGGLASLAAGFVGVGKNAKLAQNSLSQAHKAIGLGSRISQTASNAWHGLTAAITGGGAAATMATGALGKLGPAMGRTAAVTATSASAMGALSTAAAGGTSAIAGMGAATGIAAAALGAAIGTMIAVDANLHGAGDAADSFTMSLFDLVGASDESKAAALANMDAVSKERLEFFKTIPVLGDWIKEITKHNEVAPETEKAMVGVADATKVVGVAIDGTLVPLQDLAQHNLNAGATAGLLLEQAGLLGAGMKILGTEMTLAGDQAIFLANAYLETEAANIKATQEAYNIVVAYQGVEKTMSMTTEEVMVLAAQLKEQGVEVKETEKATRELSAAQQIAADMAAYETEAIISLKEESDQFKKSNLEIIDVLQREGQEFDRTAVGIMAAKQGMEEWVDAQAQAYFEIVKTAEALGFQGKAYQATTGELLTFIANAEQQNEVNAEAVDTYKTLSQGTRDYLTQLGVTAGMMGRVAEGTQDISDRNSLLIQVMAGVEDAQARNVDGMVQLVLAGEDVNRVIQLTNKQIQAEIDVLEASGQSYEQKTEAINEHREALGSLLPEIQAVAEQYNLLSIEGQENNEIFKQTFEALQDVDSGFREGIGSLVDFAVANGAVFDASNITIEGLFELVATMDLTGQSAEDMAEKMQEEAEKMAASMEAAFEDIIGAQEEWASTMSGAIKSMSQEMGEEMEVGISDIKKKVSKGFEGFSEQFATEIFPEDFLAAAIIEGNDVGDIKRELEDLMDDVLDEDIITADQAESIFRPFLNFMEQDLPEDSEAAIGYLVGRMPHLMEQITPVIVNGIAVAGGEARKVLQTGLIDPFIQGLSTLEQGASGIDFTRGIVDRIGALLPYIQAEFPRLGGLIQQTLENTALTADQKSAEIIGYLRQIDPNFAAMVDSIDQDGDGIKDIFDNEIKSPAEQMRDALLQAFLELARGLAAVNPAFEPMVAHLENVLAKSNDAASATNNLTGALSPLDQQVKAMADETWQGYVDSLGGYETATGAAIRLTPQFAQHLRSLSGAERQAAIDAYEAERGVDLLADGVGSADQTIRMFPGGFAEWNGIPGQIQNGVWTPLARDMNGFAGGTSTYGAQSASNFRSGWLGNAGSWNNLAAPVDAALNPAIPDAASLAGSDASINLLSRFEEIPPGTQQVVNDTGDEFAQLKGKLITAGSLIGVALNHILLKFTEFRDYANGPMGLGGLGVGINYGPMQTGLQVALSTLNMNTVIGLGQVMASWMLHFQALNSYIPLQFGITTQIFSQYFPLINQAVTQGLGLMLTTWINHFTALNTYVPTQLGITAQMFSQYLPLINQAVILGLGNIMLSWANHFIALNAYIPLQLGITAQMFSNYMGLVNQAVILGLGTVMLTWANHFTALNNYVNQTFPAIIGIFNTWLATAAANVLSFTSFMSSYWMIHANSVSATVGVIAGHMSSLASEYNALASGVNTTMSNISGYWITHASSLQGSVRMAVGHMVNYAREIIALGRGINQTTSQMSGYWITHSSSLRGTVSQMIGHLRRFASATASNMASVRASMDRARAAANSLRQAINSLRSKTITVTTRYRSTGKQGAARGFNGVVNRPQDIHVGEGGRPEMVSVTPLQGTAGAHHNGLAALHGMAPARAATGANSGMIVGNDGKALNLATAKDDVTEYRRHVEREIDMATQAWDDYRNDVKRYLERVNTFMDQSATKTGVLRGGGGGGGTTGGGVGGGGTTGGGPVTVPVTPKPGGPAPRNWLHEDIVDDWADKYGYTLKDYDPLSAKALKFSLVPLGSKYKYIFEDTAADWLRTHGWKFATGGYRVEGSGKSKNHELHMDVQTAQHGFKGKVRKPTMILAGEHGTESVSISPGRRMGRNGENGFNGIIDNHIILDGMEMKRWLRKVMNEDYRASRA